MIFGKRSNRELQYAKAKAKATEFLVDQSDIPDFRLNSDELHYTSVFALSSYVDARIEDRDASGYMVDLQKTASFYDAASNDKHYEKYADGYWLLAMSTYFLLGNYGSAKVCLEKVGNKSFYGKRAEKLCSLIDFFLCPSPRPLLTFPNLAGYLSGLDVKMPEVIDEASALLTDGSPEDVFFSRIAYVSIADALSCSARTLLPDFSGLSIDEWRPYLSMHTTPKLLWQAQKQIGLTGVYAGKNAFIQLPTGSGKTKSIEILLRSRMLAGRCRQAVIVAPLRALCSEIVADLAEALKDMARVRQASDVMEVDSWLRDCSAERLVTVYTPEKLSFVMHHDPELLKDSDLFVFDEAHLLSSETRGPGYELLLAEIFRLRADAQRILISAVVSNSAEIANWAFGDSKRIVEGGDIQVTEKSVGLIRRGGSKVSYVNRNNITNEDFFVFVDVRPQNLRKKPRERNPRRFPDFSGDAPARIRDLSIYYANRLVPNGACAIYVPLRKSLPPLFRRIGDLVDRGADISNLLSPASEEEMKRVSKLVCRHYGEDNWMASGIIAGILPHYGDLQGAIRQVVEYDIIHGSAKCVACTSTLAEGVNLPIKYLIVTGVKKGYFAPSTRDFQNLIGRTARSGKYSEGSVLIADDLSSSGNKAMYSHLMDEENVERCESAITNLLSDAFACEEGRVIPGNSVVQAILDNLADPHLEANLVNALQNRLGCDERKARALALQRLRPLEAIENYLSGYVSLDDDEVAVDNLCSSTYAYASSDEGTRKKLIDLFRTIFKSLQRIGGDRVFLVHVMQTGMRTAVSISKWVESAEGRRFIEGGCQDTELVAEQFVLTNPSVVGRFDGKQLAAVVDLWIDGANLLSIAQSLNDAFDFQPALKAEAVEKVVSRTVRFSFSHFISCVLDAAKQTDSLSSAETIEALTILQRKVKYGVSGMREVAICEEVVDDRMIAKDLISIIGEEGPCDSDFMRLQALAKQDEIERYADSLPAYCANSILNWIWG